MEVLKNQTIDTFRALRTCSLDRSGEIDGAVKSILEEVKTQGDAALRKFSLEFDGLRLDSLEVTETAIRQSRAFISDELKQAIAVAAGNIERYHPAAQNDESVVETSPGIRCWSRRRPIERVGLYIPGGSAPLVSTLLMLGIPAKQAGCKEIVVCTPPYQDGNPHPAVLYVASALGLTRLFQVGGAQAIAALAYGTESIPKVDKIFGPGNQFVTRAKELVSAAGVAIDMPAGPSEVLIIADRSARPDWVAADLLSQAEHGPDSQVILITPEEQLIALVLAELERQLENLPRSDIAAACLRKSFCILCRDLEEAVAMSNAYAPEHLILAVKNPTSLSELVSSAGSVFLGHYSPEVAGDYASGTNHVLPTNAAARAYSGISVESFMKRISFQELSREGLESICPSIVELARAEELEAHARAALIRGESYE